MYERFAERLTKEALSNTPVVLTIGPRRAAQRAVLRAAPFEPLPEGAGVKSILMPVVYRIAER
ncbi:MAG: hypothetical protein OXF33_01470 [Rhodospirillales bacterium]|nr:hypothetical protein [Rhodospirillales bacterium]